MNQDFTEQGVRVLEAFSQQLEQSPAYSSAMLMALNFLLGPTQEIVIAGNAGSTDTKQMLKLVHGKFMPNAVVLLHEQGSKGAAIEQIVPFITNQIAKGGKTTAYVCENYVCNRPINKIDDLDKILSGVSDK